MQNQSYEEYAKELPRACRKWITPPIPLQGARGMGLTIASSARTVLKSKRPGLRGEVGPSGGDRSGEAYSW